MLCAAGGILSATAAGCLDGAEQSRGAGGPLYASFFTLEEFTAAVVGDERQVENAVPDGEHGHAWNPRTSIVPEITAADAFVYLGAEGFQHWVDDALPELETEYDELTLIDALDGIELLEYDDDSQSHEDSDRTVDLAVAQVTVLDRDHDETLVYAHGGHWHDDPLWLPRGDARSLEITAEDDAGDALTFGDAYELAVRTADGASDALVEYDPDEDVDGGHITLHGIEDGFTELVVQVLEDGDVVYETPPLETEVGTHDHGHGDHGHGYSHGVYDAKFFSDPVLAARGVETIRDELIALDPEHEATYEANAAAYVEKLEALDRTYEERLSDRDHDLVVLAGHDSFRYLSKRYEFEIHTPVGLSPDSTPSSEAIAETVELIEEHEIEYVLWDYFDGDRLARTIAEEAETVDETLMVSPAEATTDSWRADGYGDYLGQMTEINLPALEKALGAE